MSLARYTGQSRKLRELAVEKLGAEKVACMSDEEVTSFVDGEYAIFWGDCTDGFAGHGPDEETIVLVRNDAFRELRESGAVVFVER
ncbi:hypothetical protein [Enterorhabdus sp. P55]|uniref:hypothetical protein n=1 Tax=Enterorhabdus sp. P55 TaxID=2304571 RepID=UPI00136B57CB|nr:hypothetical protein [Enterorhabdus sp. P55]NBI31870.1 hypothetical protein [Enterorhabdus sp. P55]